MKRSTLAFACAAGLAAAGGIAWLATPAPVAVETAAVARGPFELAVTEDGRTRVRDRYVVSAPLAGRVERVALKPGDPVERGTPLAWLAPTAPALLDARTERELRERLGAADSQLLRARAERLRAAAQRDQAESDHRRQESLAAGGFVAATALEQSALAREAARRAFEGAQFAEHGAEHDLAQARAAIERYRQGGGPRWAVTSPVAGVVLKVLQESEAAVALGAPLVEVADASSLEAVVDLLSQDAIAVRPGMPARVELGPAAAPLAARVRRVEPAAFTKVSALGIEEQRVNVVLDFAEPLDGIRTLGDGFRVDARIVTRRVDEGLVVPVGALFREGGEWALFAVEGARAAKRRVDVRLRNGAEALVAAGVREGEVVVVYPSDALADGARVRVLKRTPAPRPAAAPAAPSPGSG